MFLTREELQELTGLKRQGAIKRWLRREKIGYLDAADGWPRVLQSVVINRLSGTKPAQEAREPQLRLRHAS